MKKFFMILGIIFLLFIGGCVAFSAMFVNSVDESIKSYEEEQATYNEIAQQMVDETEWTIEDSEYGSKYIVGYLTNNQDYMIDYFEIGYKLIDENGVTVLSSFTNETDIEPGETVKIEIDAYKDFVDYKLTGEMSVYSEQ